MIKIKKKLECIKFFFMVFNNEIIRKFIKNLEKMLVKRNFEIQVYDFFLKNVCNIKQFLICNKLPILFF
jgi:hypothetical protein